MKTELFILWLCAEILIAQLLLIGWLVDAELFRLADGVFDLSMIFAIQFFGGMFLFFRR